MEKIKRILALIGAVLLVCLYGSTLVSALMDSPAADGLLRASIAATILIPVLLYAFILMPEQTASGFGHLDGLPLTTIALGGLLAIVVVSATNLVIPMIPAVYSSLLMSSGQILASVALDAAMYSIFSPALLAGALIMLAGIALNFVSQRSPED